MNTPVYDAVRATQSPATVAALDAAEAAVEHERAALVMSGFAAAFFGYWADDVDELGDVA